MKQNITDYYIENIYYYYIENVVNRGKSLYFHFVILEKNMCAESIPSKVVQYEQFLNERLKTDLR